jgi:hypothetical protein
MLKYGDDQKTSRKDGVVAFEKVHGFTRLLELRRDDVDSVDGDDGLESQLARSQRTQGRDKRSQHHRLLG